MAYRSNITRILAEAEARAEIVVQKIAADVEAGGKARAAVDTGHMKNSIHTVTHGRHEAEIRVGAEYGIYVEHGTRHMAAQPFMIPSAEAARPGFLDALRHIYGGPA